MATIIYKDIKTIVMLLCFCQIIFRQSLKKELPKLRSLGS